MDLLSLPLGIGQAAGDLLVFTSRLKLYMQRKSRRREVGARLKNALSAIDSLEEARKALDASNQRMAGILDGSPIPVPMGTADRLYAEVVAWTVSTAAVLVSLVKLAAQAKAVSQYKTFMQDLKILDKPVYELVMMLARSYDGARFDPSEFPTFLALYGPQFEEDEVKGAIDKEFRPRINKLKRMTKSLPPPFRRRLPPMKRAVRQLQDSQRSISTIEADRLKAMVDRSPPWLRTLTEMMAKELESEQKPRRGFRK